MVRDNAERPWREDHGEVAQIGEVNLVFMDCEYARKHEVVGASDQRDELYARGVAARRLQPRKQSGVRPELPTHTRPDPVGPVGAAVRRAQRDAAIDSARAAELLDVDPSDQSTEAVADEIDTATPNVSPQILPQGQRSLVDSGSRVVVERQDLLDAPELEVRRQGEQRGSVGQVAVDEDDGALIPLAGSPTLRSPDAEGKEHAGCREAERLLCDQTPRGLLGDRIILDHRDTSDDLPASRIVLRIFGFFRVVAYGD
jgi:hypothetical protein